MRRVSVDGGNAVEVMFYSTFQQIGLADERIMSVTTPLVKFDEASMVLIGTIKLEVIVKDKLLMVELVIVIRILHTTS